MEKFHIWDVISVLGLPGPVSGRSSYDIPCPVCDKGRRSRHLNINLHKEVYRCPKCGISGGIFDLYALYTGVPRNQVRREMLDRLNWNQSAVSVPRTPKVVIPENRESLPAPIEIRHAVYTAMLKKLSLEPDHRENLRGRGLMDAEIEALGYKSTLTVGMTQIAAELEQEGYALAGVPGFFRTDTGIWRFTINIRGILIPVRNPNGQIQGLQVRLDNMKKRKFRWVSSTGLKDGCKAESWVHLAGAISEEILLTEGPMKADIIHALNGHTVLAVPGVHSLKHLEKTLAALKEQGLKRIMTAFDMDMLTNPHVEKAYHALLMLLSGMGFSFGTYLWDSRYKGLDDYIWASLMGRRR